MWSGDVNGSVFTAINFNLTMVPDQGDTPKNSGRDIAEIMKKRASGTDSGRYSMDTETNTMVLTSELDTFEPGSEALQQTISLLRLWNWIDRAETLCGRIEDGFGWTAKTLCDAGCWSLLGFDSEPTYNNDKHVVLDALGCKTYDSTRRRYDMKNGSRFPQSLSSFLLFPKTCLGFLWVGRSFGSGRGS